MKLGILFISLALALVACTKSPAPPGSVAGLASDATGSPHKPQGIQVGNGLTASFVTDYRLKIAYHPELNLHEVSHSEFIIDNAANLQPGEERSFISFAVFREGDIEDSHIGGLSQLNKFLATKFPLMPFQPVTINGLRGFVHKTAKEKQLEAWYFMRLPTSDIVLARIEAHAAQDGLQRIPPIVETLKLDETPPVVDHLELLSTRVARSQRLQFRYHAVDDLSGVAGNFSLNIRSLSGNQVHASSVRAQRLEDDWFLADVGVASLPPGRYLVEAMMVADRAGNRRVLKVTAESVGSKKYSSTAGNPEIPLLRFQILALAEEIHSSPEIEQVGVASSEIRAGQTAYLTFRARDDRAGLLPYRTVWGLFAPCFADENVPMLTIEGQLERTGKDTYRLPIHTDRYLPPGRYFLRNFDLPNQALKLTKLHATDPQAACGTGATYQGDDQPALSIPSLTIVNPSVADITPPQITRVKVRSEHVTAGEPISVLFQATDDYAGIARYLPYAGLMLCGAETKDAPSAVPLSGPVRPLDDDWYELEIDTDADSPTIDCWLQKLRVLDAAGNAANLEASSATDFSFLAGPTPLAPPRVRVDKAAHPLDWQLFDLP